MAMAYRWNVMIAIMLGIFMFLIDITVVNVALAKFQAVFAVDVTTVQWVITGYALASGMATPLASYFSDRWGAKRVWLLALSIFTLSSILCGVSPAFPILIVGRILQGFAGGMLLPIGIAQLFTAFPPDQRGLALGFFAIPIVAGPALGPTLGGYIVTHSDWRLVFFINAPIGFLAVLLGAILLRDQGSERAPHFDTWGAIFSVLGFGTILYGLSRAAPDGWGSLKVAGLLGFGMVCLIIFAIAELSQDEPLLELRLFANYQFLIANVVGWVSTVALFGAEFLLPLYLQNLRGLTAVDTGLLLMPQGLAAGLMGPIAGRLTDKIGARYVVAFGFVLLAVNTYNLSQLTMGTSYETLRLLLLIRGAALGCALQPTQLVSLAVVPRRLLTSASSLNNALRNVFQSFGVALLGTVVQSQTAVHVATLRETVTATSTGGQFIGHLSLLLQLRAGIAATAAQTGALAVMVGQIQQQAAVLAFGDAYRFTFFTAVFAIALSFLLPGRGAVKADPSLMAGGH
jgi:MFS transporter, DHA2 family, multidrug resistance protein